jgi:hypothetical protein
MQKLRIRHERDETGSYEYEYYGVWGEIGNCDIRSIKRVTDDRCIYSREW